jgi:hypothetical protein
VKQLSETLDGPENNKELPNQDKPIAMLLIKAGMRKEIGNGPEGFSKF